MSESIWTPGQRVEDFEIEKQIGAGGMADLYLGKDLQLERKVVIKVLNLRFSTCDEFVRNFLREARIQANLENPYIVQVLGLFNFKERPCLVMQHIRGTDLDKVVKKARSIREKQGDAGALSVERALHIFHQILEGIGFVHKFGIIHGDIKPANILLNEQGRAKVTDFGLSFLLAAQSDKDEGVMSGGTPHYMSPERIMNEAVDHRSDIYALGITLFYMITGRLPLAEVKNISALVEAHLEGDHDEPAQTLAQIPDLSAGARSAILKALKRDPKKRHQSCLEFALSIKQDGPSEMYSELLRRSLMAKDEISPAERVYLDRLAKMRGLDAAEARAVEENIRKEMGLPALDNQP